MKLFLVSLMLAALVASADNHWGVPEEEHVAVLKKDNFEDFIKNNKYAFVKFYAPWCGHCKTMIPAYSKLAQRMKAETEGVAIGKVDATVENDIGSKYGVQGFPTLKLFINGEPVDYAGGREEDAMFNWLKKKTGPSAVEITDAKALEEHAGKSLSVLFLHPEGDAEALKAYTALAAAYDDVPFAHSSSDEYKKKYEVDQKYGFVVFRDFDDGRKFLVSNEVPTTANLKTFFESVRFPLVMDFDQKAAERIFGSESPAIIFFSDDANDSNAEAFKNVAQSRKGDILFTKSSVTGGLGARLCEFLGVTAADAPTVRIIRFKNGALDKFKVSDLSEKSIGKALDDFKADKLSAYHKSAPVPEDDGEDVKVIVGDTFEKIVLSDDKYVLLESYAPWCGHCKSLEPIYKELAEKVKGVKNLVIAKMDATANEHPSLNVKGFPTINFFKPGSKSSPDTYNGERTLEGFLKYLKEQMGKDFDADTVETEL
mgnify:CR=1 FL=1